MDGSAKLCVSLFLSLFSSQQRAESPQKLPELLCMDDCLAVVRFASGWACCSLFSRCSPSDSISVALSSKHYPDYCVPSLATYRGLPSSNFGGADFKHGWPDSYKCGATECNAGRYWSVRSKCLVAVSCHQVTQCLQRGEFFRRVVMAVIVAPLHAREPVALELCQRV